MASAGSRRRVAILVVTLLALALVAQVWGRRTGVVTLAVGAVSCP